MTVYHKLVGMVCVCVLIALLTSCGASTDSASTVDDAVALLQDLNDRNVWEIVSDRLTTLSDQTGYRATFTLQSGSITASGEIAAPPETDLTLVIEVDDTSNAHITVTENGQTATYVVLGYANDADRTNTRIYRAEDNGFVCVTEGEYFNLFQGGIYTLFNVHQIETIGMRTLAVAEKTDNEDAIVVGREAIEYDLVSKVEDALKIVAEFDNADLQSALDAAGPFELTGDLYLDQETLALLRVTIFYTDLTTQQGYDLFFEVTQWGDVADVEIPAGTDIVKACG